ncbi:MAG: hypothetical protein RLZZ511_549 [Cyanobacteriota bacterium]|jgi:membrane protease YdiL (CAAX protease family)
MSKHYLDAVHQGQNDWWRYILSVVLILVGGLIFGGIATAMIAMVVVLATQPALLSDATQVESALMAFLSQPTPFSFVLNNLPFLAIILGLVISTKFIHGRPFRSLISQSGQFSGTRFLTGFGVWFGILALSLVISLVATPGDLVWNFDLRQWLPLLVVVLIFTPLQTAAEELFCRGYLMQALGLLTRNRFLLMGVPSLLFALGHFSNPEMARGAVWMALSYWALGVFLAAITLRDNRLELALGVHAAQNIFVLLLLNSKDSVLKTPSVWLLKETGDPMWGLVWLVLYAGLFYWIVFHGLSHWRKQTRSEQNPEV